MTKKIKPNWTKFFSRGQHPVLINDICWQTLISQPKVTGLPKLNFYKRDISSTYFDKEEFDKLSNFLKQQLRNNPEKVLSSLKKAQKLYRSVLRLAKQYNRYNWRKASDKKIRQKLLIFIRRLIYIYYFVYYPLWLERAGVELLDELFKTMKPKKREKIIWQITRPVKLTSREKFRLSVLDLACAIEKSKKSPNIKTYQDKINKIIKKFGHLPTYLLNVRLYTKDEIWNEIKYFISKGAYKERKKELDFYKRQKKERNATLTKFASRIQKIANVMSHDVWLRDERVVWFGKPVVLAYPLFCEAAKRHGVSYKEFVQQRINEIEAGGIPKKELKKRLRGYTYIVKNGIVEILEHQERKNISDKKKIIRGQIANPGKVRGRVRIGTAYTFYQLKPGEIAVTGMTTPEAALFLKRAAAFVTDEGGITCHAAILSRELNKPCIIGTKIATKVLKDGDLVEVDADKGVVKILKKI